MDSERTLAQKIILWALLGLAVVFTAVYIILKCLPGVAFEDTLLKVSEQGTQTVYTGEQYGDAITIVTYPEGTGHVVTLTIGTSIDHTYRVEYPGGTIKGEHGGTYERLTITRVRDGDVVKIIFDGGYDPDASSSFSKFCTLSGELDLLIDGKVTVSNDPWYNYELAASQVLSFAEGAETTTRGNWALYAVALFCSVICAVAVAFPYTLFELRYHWSVRDPEPTDFYLRMNELGGAIAAAAILIAYIVGATKIV